MLTAQYVKVLLIEYLPLFEKKKFFNFMELFRPTFLNDIRKSFKWFELKPKHLQTKLS